MTITRTPAERVRAFITNRLDVFMGLRRRGVHSGDRNSLDNGGRQREAFNLPPRLDSRLDVICAHIQAQDVRLQLVEDGLYRATAMLAQLDDARVHGDELTMLMDLVDASKFMREAIGVPQADRYVTSADQIAGIMRIGPLDDDREATLEVHGFGEEPT